MIFKETNLAGSFIIELQPIVDDRGWFARTYCKDKFASIGHNNEWVQMNHSFTKSIGTIRGMHFQLPPFSEIKLVRCIAGAVFDVIVDIRQDSSTFLKWFGIELSADNKKMIYIPEGFAHGFQTLAPNTELIYHHSEFYSPNTEGGLNFADEKLNINWNLPITSVSERDLQHQFIKDNFQGIKIEK